MQENIVFDRKNIKLYNDLHDMIYKLFGSAVAVAFQITFCAEIYQNDIFFIF